MHQNTPDNKIPNTEKTQSNYPLNRFSVAPMLDGTDRVM